MSKSGSVFLSGEVKSGGTDRTLEVPIRVRIRGSLPSMLRRASNTGAPATRRVSLVSPASRLGASLLFGLAFGAAMGLFRVMLGVVMPGGSITNGLDWVSYEQLETLVFSVVEPDGLGEDRLANPFIWFGFSIGILAMILASIAAVLGVFSSLVRRCGR